MNEDTNLERDLAEHYREMAHEPGPGFEGSIGRRLEEPSRPRLRRSSLVAPLGLVAAAALVAAVIGLPMLVRPPAVGPGADTGSGSVRGVSQPAAATPMCSDGTGAGRAPYAPVGTDDPADVSFAVLSDQRVLGAAFHDGTTVLSDDGGRRWYRTNVRGYYVIAATSARDLWAVGGGGAAGVTVLRCRDLGKWETTTVQLEDESWGLSLRAYDSTHAWIVARGQNLLKLLRTTDGGVTWSASNVAGPQFSTVTPSDANTIWASADPSAVTPTDQLLRVSRDGGVTWSDALLPGLPSNDGAVEPQPDPSTGAGNAWIYTPPTFWSPDRGFVAVYVKAARGTETRFFETSDAGRTWTPAASLSAGYSPVFASDKVWLALTPDSKSYQRTTDGGKTWQKVTPKLPAGTHFLSISMYDGDWGIAVVADDAGPGYYNGRVYASADGGLSWHPYDLYHA